MGVKLLWDDEKWEGAIGFYKNDELGNSKTSKHYSVDVISNAGGAYAGAQAGGSEETNQLNLRVARKIKHGEFNSTSVGLSAQVRQLYNQEIAERVGHWAGPVFTYFDVISSKNMIFSGGEMVNEIDEGRTTRFNLNVGYYF